VTTVLAFLIKIDEIWLGFVEYLPSTGNALEN